MGLQYNERNVEMKNEELGIRNEKGNTVPDRDCCI